MPENIKYEKGIVNSSAEEIEQNIQQFLSEKTVEFDNIANILSVSKGDEVEAIKVQLASEKRAIEGLAEFYMKLLEMIRNVSRDVDQTEQHYGQEHVTGGVAGD